MKILLKALVLLHSVIISLNFICLFYLPALTPWYVWVPCCTLVARMLFTDNRCPLTILENKIREKIGMPQIEGFVKHYFGGILWI